jgi:hypothetical protein
MVLVLRTMWRRTGVTVALLVLPATLGVACAPPPAVSRRGEGKSGLTLECRSSYARGETVRIDVALQNRSTTPCGMLRMTDGTLTIQSMTRNGVPVVPTTRDGGYMESFQMFVHRHVVAVAPGESVSVPWESATELTPRHASLETSVTTWSGMDLKLWPVDEPGRYELTVSYAAPRGVPADVCPLADGASIGFVVSG